MAHSTFKRDIFGATVLFRKQVKGFSNTEAGSRCKGAATFEIVRTDNFHDDGP